MISKIWGFVTSLKTRIADNKKTTFGGSIAGVALAALIAKVESDSGCHFKEAFAGMDWLQVLGFVAMQTFGAITTDGNKTV